MPGEDRTLKILLQLQSDLAGVQQAKAAVTDLKQTLDSTAGPTKSIAEQLAAAGATFDPLSRSFRSIKTDSEGAAKSTKEVAESGFLAGASLNKAKGEAVVLARELATGSVNARTVGALLGSLGTNFSIIAIGGFVVANIIKDIVNYGKDLNKEIDKTTEKIASETIRWELMASAIKDASGAFNLSEQIGRQMLGAEQKLDEFRKKQLTFWEQFLNDALVMARIGDPRTLLQGQIIPQGPQAAALAEAIQKARVEQALLLLDLSKFYQLSVQTAAVWESIKTEPFAQGIQDAEAQVEKIKQQIANLGPARSVDDFLKFTQLNDNLEKAQHQLSLLRGEATNAADEARRLDDALEKSKLITLDPSEKIKVLQQDLDRANKELERMGFSSVELAIELLAVGGAGARSADELKALVSQIREIIALQTQLNSAKAQETKADTSAARKDLLADLRAQETLIQHIRQEQQLIDASSFLSPDEKAKQSLQSMVSEMQALQTYIDKLNADKLKPLDPVQLEQVNQKLQQTQFQFDLLKLKVQGLQQPLVADLQKWVNSFGTTAQQISHTIQGTINASLQQFNQLLLTGKFNAQQLLQSVVQLGLTLIEQLILQRAMQAINHTASIGEAVASGPAIAAAYAPAATMVSIATEGQADIQAPAMVAAALASIQGMVFVERGGLVTGPTMTMMGEAGPEFVFSAPAVRNIGAENLHAAHEAARGMSAGGVTSTSSSAGRGQPIHNTAVFFDRSQMLAWLKDRDGVKTIIDAVRSDRNQLGI